MEFTLQKLFQLYPALQELSQTKLSLPAAIKVKKFLKLVEAETKVFREAQEEILLQERKAFPNGKLTDERARELSDEANKVARETVVEIEMKPISVKDIKAQSVTPSLLFDLDFMIEEPDENETENTDIPKPN